MYSTLMQSHTASMTRMHVWYMYTVVICSTRVSMKLCNLIQDIVKYRNELNEFEKNSIVECL